MFYATQEKEGGDAPLLCHPLRSAMWLCAHNILLELDHNFVIRRKSESQNTWQSSASERQGSGFQIHILEFVVEMACPPW